MDWVILYAYLSLLSLFETLTQCSAPPASSLPRSSDTLSLLICDGIQDWTCNLLGGLRCDLAGCSCKDWLGDRPSSGRLSFPNNVLKLTRHGGTTRRGLLCSGESVLVGLEEIVLRGVPGIHHGGILFNDGSRRWWRCGSRCGNA